MSGAFNHKSMIRAWQYLCFEKMTDELIKFLVSKGLTPDFFKELEPSSFKDPKIQEMLINLQSEIDEKRIIGPKIDEVIKYFLLIHDEKLRRIKEWQDYRFFKMTDEFIKILVREELTINFFEEFEAYDFTQDTFIDLQSEIDEKGIIGPKIDEVIKHFLLIRDMKNKWKELGFENMTDDLITFFVNKKLTPDQFEFPMFNYQTHDTLANNLQLEIYEKRIRGPTIDEVIMFINKHCVNCCKRIESINFNRRYCKNCVCARCNKNVIVKYTKACYWCKCKASTRCGEKRSELSNFCEIHENDYLKNPNLYKEEIRWNYFQPDYPEQ